MKTRRIQRLLLLGPLLGCGSAGYSVDSVTSACRQNPAYCALVTGEETFVPTVKGAAEVASISATIRLLSADTKKRIEQELVECVEWADTRVNLRRFGGNEPSREQCREQLLGGDPCGRKITRAMQLGTEKHLLALQCTQEKLDRLIPGRFSLEQRYRYDKQTGSRKLISRKEVQMLRKQDCGDLKGTLVPDVVIHTGNPLEPQAVYDFKFPCPPSNSSQWTEYPEGHPHHPESQGDMYKEALSPLSYRVAPKWGVE